MGKLYDLGMLLVSLENSASRYVSFRPVFRIDVGDHDALAAAGMKHFAVSGVDADVTDTFAAGFEEQKIADAQERFINLLSFGSLAGGSSRQRNSRLIKHVLYVRGAIECGGFASRRSEAVRRSDIVLADVDQA